MPKHKVKPSEFFFFLAGILILASLPWLASFGVNFWIAGKVSYFLGLLLFIFKK